MRRNKYQFKDFYMFSDNKSHVKLSDLMNQYVRIESDGAYFTRQNLLKNLKEIVFILERLEEKETKGK